MRRTPLVTGEIFHIFNRGVARQPTFLSKRDYEQALLTLSYYRFQNLKLKLSRFKELGQTAKNKLVTELRKENNLLVEVISFVFMPNHFHFLLRQVVDGGITKFLSQFSNSYTKYFNTKQERVGPVFQGVFKSVHVETDEQLIHLSRYIHINPVVSFVIKEEELFSYPWSSLPDFLRADTSLVFPELVFGQFSSLDGYKKFLLDQIDYAKKLQEIKHLLLE